MVDLNYVNGIMIVLDQGVWETCDGRGVLYLMGYAFCVPTSYIQLSLQLNRVRQTGIRN